MTLFVVTSYDFETFVVCSSISTFDQLKGSASPFRKSFDREVAIDFCLIAGTSHILAWIAEKIEKKYYHFMEAGNHQWVKNTETKIHGQNL
jgi:hypothetical protein